MSGKIWSVWCSLRFIGFHQWKGAPQSVDYLKDNHRHEFHVRAAKRVQDGSDREIEFHTLKEQLQRYLNEAYGSKSFEYSCEQIAADLLDTFGLMVCEVSEDGENWGRVEIDMSNE